MFEGQVIGFMWVLYYSFWMLINIFSALWIYKDARKLPVLFVNSQPIWWALGALVLGGIWVMLIYWAIHHSTLSNRENSNEI